MKQQATTITAAAITNTPVPSAMRITQTSRYGSLDVRAVWPYVLIAIIALPLLLWNLESYPVPWFDEGFTTHASRVLAEYGFYGTYNAQDGYIHFDSGVSTGPTLVIPIALSFKLFGYGTWQARLVNVMYTLAMLWGFYALMKRLYGRNVGLLSVLMLLAWPNLAGVGFLNVSRQVLGETPALAFMAVGWYALFKSWSGRSTKLAALSGLLFGLGMVTKSQVAIVFLPALGLISLLRLPQDKGHWVRWAAPVVITLAVSMIWRGVEYAGQLGASPAVQKANADGYVQSIELLLLPFNFGSLLKRSDWLLVLAMLVGGLACLWRVRIWQMLNPSVFRQPNQFHNRRYEEATLGLFSVLYALWYGFVSIGWSRYGFVGYVVGILLCSKLLRDVMCWALARLPRTLQLGRPINLTHQFTVMITIGLLAAASLDLLTMQVDDSAKQTASFIHNHIPREAVVETWEWELDAISGHWEVHHPSEADDFEAIRQIFYEKRMPRLAYDELQANPDYLIEGTMSDYTGVYDPETLSKHFQLLTEIGSYRIYERIR
jgi:hypothetical protein